MSWRTAVGAVATVLVVALSGACSSSTSDGAPRDAGADVVDARAPDAAHDAAGVDAESACVPADVTTFTPPAYVPASGAHQGACTTAQIRAFYDACLGASATQATCAPFAQSTGTLENRACAACIVTPDTATRYGALVLHHGVVDVNVAGCMELLDPVHGLQCAKAYEAANACGRAACASNCPVSDDASFLLYQGCLDQAASGGCKWYAQGTSCANAEVDGGPAATCFAGASFEEVYLNVAPIFCAGAADAGGG